MSNKDYIGHISEMWDSQQNLSRTLVSYKCKVRLSIIDLQFVTTGVLLALGCHFINFESQS